MSQPYPIDADPTSRWWLYTWGGLPTNLPTYGHG